MRKAILGGTWRTLLMVLCMSAACGDDGGDNGSNTLDGGLTIDAAQPAVDAEPQLMELDALCDDEGPYVRFFLKLIECSPESGYLGIGGSANFSPEAFEAICRSAMDSLLESGNVSIDESKIANCFSYIESVDCSDRDLEDVNNTPCAEMFVGTRATGETCESDQECEGVAYCDNAETDCGTCADRKATGQKCEASKECVSGHCRNGMCAEYLEVGESCSYDSECVSRNCIEFVCETRDSVLPVAGEPCELESEEADCAPLATGLACGSNNQCEELPGIGEACLEKGHTYLCDIREYAWCDDGTCAAPEISQSGEDCRIFSTQGSAAKKCADGLVCPNPFSGSTCLPLGFPGDSCADSASECHFILSCEEGVCVGDEEYEGVCSGD